MMMYFRGIGGLGRCFGGGFGYMSNFMHSGWGLVMMGIALVVAALVVVAIVALVKKGQGHHPVNQSDDSLELLNARFVKGEISEEDYIRMKKVLTGK
ncbi:SHOCT domain-containing protein [Oscillospiraceae bacterium WX1]